MRITFSNNPIDKLSCWFENEVIEPISRYYYSKKKSHYQCANGEECAIEVVQEVAYSREMRSENDT